jgi:hypothetical protein
MTQRLLPLGGCNRRSRTALDCGSLRKRAPASLHGAFAESIAIFQECPSVLTRFQSTGRNLAKLLTEREPRRRIAQPAEGKLNCDSLPTVRQPPKEGRLNPPVASERRQALPHETKRAIQRRLQALTDD